MSTLITTSSKLESIIAAGEQDIWYKILCAQEKVVHTPAESDNEKKYVELLHKMGIHTIEDRDHIVENLHSTPRYIDNLNRHIMLLDIDSETAELISKDYGVCCFSSYSTEMPYIAKRGRNIDTDDDRFEKSWRAPFNGFVKNSNSILIIDRYLFNRQWNKGDGLPDETIDDCKYNLESILDNILPAEMLDNKLTISIILSDESCCNEEILDKGGNTVRDEKGHPKYSYYSFNDIVDMITDVKARVWRPYAYDIEVFGINKKCEHFSETHDRYVITNSLITNAPKKLVAYTPDERIHHRQLINVKYLYSEGLDGDSSLPEYTLNRVVNAMKKLITDSKPLEIKYAINGAVAQQFKTDMVKNNFLKIS